MADSSQEPQDAIDEEEEITSTGDSLVDQPGLAEVREAVANHLEAQIPERKSIRQDGLAGLSSAITSVPDGLASGVLAGVNPIYGLHACMAGPIAGGIFGSTQLMVVVTTSASALAAGQALAGVPAEARTDALFLMVVLVGLFCVAFSLLRLGRLIRFVSFSVMTGFIIGIAVLTIISQLSTITGYETSGNNRVGEVINLLSNLGQVHLWTLGLAVLALLLAIVLPRTWLGNVGRLFAIIVPSLLLALVETTGAAEVQRVGDVGEIPGGVPLPSLPALSALNADVVTGALAVAVIILVQGAGVSQSVPNPDGSRRSMSRDFAGQGAGNIASGFFQGLPVGGSLSTTALSVISGARSRWAAILAGVWMAVIVIVFSTPVTNVAMPALGALLIIASSYTIKPQDIESVRNAGWTSILAGGTTFLSTLFVPIQAAVGIGVALSAMLYIFASSSDISVVALSERDDGSIEERQPPKELPPHEMTVLDVYGNLFFAGARTLERRLPNPNDAERAVVILRLRGRTQFGATLFDVLGSYADKLVENNGRLYLSGISEKAYEQIAASGQLRLTGPVRAYTATTVRGQSTREAIHDAQAWLVNQGEAEDSGEGQEGDE